MQMTGNLLGVKNQKNISLKSISFRVKKCREPRYPLKFPPKHIG